jgi:lysophospholipase L1-like esterase
MPHHSDAWHPTARRHASLALPLLAGVGIAWQWWKLRSALRAWPGLRLDARGTRGSEAGPASGTAPAAPALHAAAHPPRVLLVGDSTGVGAGALHVRDSIGGLLAAAYREAEVVNHCRNGARVADTAVQLARLQAEGRRCDMALVFAGGNDVLRLTPHASLALHARALLAAAHGVARHVVWLGCADIGGAPAFVPPLSWLLSWRTSRTMRLLAGEAERAGVRFIRFDGRGHDEVFAADPGIYFAADGLHPSAASYRRCFEVLRQRVPLHRWLGTAAGRAG